MSNLSIHEAATAVKEADRQREHPAESIEARATFSGLARVVLSRWLRRAARQKVKPAPRRYTESLVP